MIDLATGTFIILTLSPIYYGMYRIIKIGLIVEGCPYCMEKRTKTDKGVMHIE